MVRTSRDAAIADAVRRRQLPIDDVAEMFGLSRRSIYRALRRTARPPHPSRPG
jgi:DNA-binding phage protein